MHHGVDCQYEEHLEHNAAENAARRQIENHLASFEKVTRLNGTMSVASTRSVMASMRLNRRGSLAS